MDAKENVTAKAAEGEKTPMSLADLGLEDEQTPAEKSEAQAKEEHKTITRKDGVKIEQISAIDPKDAEEHPQMKVPRPENTKLTSYDMQTQHLKGDTRPSVSVKGNQPAKHEYQEGHVIPAHAKGTFAKEQANAIDTVKQGEATVNMEGLTRGDDNNPKVESENYTIVSNVNDIAKNPTRDKTVVPPIQRTLNHLHDLADKGIQRTENEMMAAGGRIDEAKEKYVESRYKTLMERSKQSPNLKKKIDFYLKAMETDPSFDGATDYMKKGYILFKVANDNSIGITDKSFGLAQESIKGRRNSAEAAKNISETVEGANGDKYDNENQVVLGNADEYRNAIPVKSSDEVAAEKSSGTVGTVIQLEESAFNDLDKEGDDGLYADQVKENLSQEVLDPNKDIPINPNQNVPVSATITTSDAIAAETTKSPAVVVEPDVFNPDVTDDMRVEVGSSELERGLIEPDIPTDDIMLDEMNQEAKKVESEIERMYGVSDEKYRQMEIDYLRQAAKLLNINGDANSLINISEGGAVNLNTALKLFKQQDMASGSTRNLKATWPLMFTGMPAEMTAFSGQELTQFIDTLQSGFVPTEQNPNPQPSMAQLRSVFSALYNHFVNPGRPNFDGWLHQIASNDFYDLIFAQYKAQFHSNNYLAYQCPKRGCAKLFLEKKNIMDMVRFPDPDENGKDSKVKERFEAILKKDSVMTNLYRTNPIPINQYFAMSFITPSIYSMSFEPASLSLNFKKKYEAVIGFLPMLDAVWIIDHRNGGKKHRIEFGVIPNDLEKTVMRKVNGLTKILSTFNVDQRSIIYGEYLKVVKNMQKEEISYQIPATKCPVCGTEIPAEITDPIGALFTRARLSIEAASTPALL